MTTPRYEIRCARLCTDTLGRPRTGTEYVHIYGQTLWVCHPCGEQMGHEAGIPTDSQVRSMRRRIMRKAQVHMDEVALAADLEEYLGEPTSAGTDATPVRPGA